jgi:hypothetical protein
MLVVLHSTATSLFFIRTDDTALPGRQHDLFTGTRTKPTVQAETWFTDGSGFSSPTVSELQSREAARHQWQCNGTGLAGEAGTRAMSTDAMRETEPKNLHLLGNHRQVARCKSVCAGGTGSGTDGAAAGTASSTTRGARFVLRPQNKAAKSGMFLLKPKEEATKGTKKNQSKLKNFDRVIARTF